MSDPRDNAAAMANRLHELNKAAKGADQRKQQFKEGCVQFALSLQKALIEHLGASGGDVVFVDPDGERGAATDATSGVKVNEKDETARMVIAVNLQGGDTQ